MHRLTARSPAPPKRDKRAVVDGHLGKSQGKCTFQISIQHIQDLNIKFRILIIVGLHRVQRGSLSVCFPLGSQLHSGRGFILAWASVPAAIREALPIWEP